MFVGWALNFDRYANIIYAFFTRRPYLSHPLPGYHICLFLASWAKYRYKVWGQTQDQGTLNQLPMLSFWQSSSIVLCHKLSVRTPKLDIRWLVSIHELVQPGKNLPSAWVEFGGRRFRIMWCSHIKWWRMQGRVGRLAMLMECWMGENCWRIFLVRGYIRYGRRRRKRRRRWNWRCRAYYLKQ